MSLSSPQWVISALFVWFISVPTYFAQTKVEKPEKKETSLPKKTKTPKEIKDLQIPADTVIIICEKLKEAKELFPRMIILRPDKYREMQKEIRRLKEMLSSREITPSACTLAGEVNGDSLFLKASYTIETTAANTVVQLGCKGTSLKSWEMEGKLPRLKLKEAGWTVQIPNPGTYQLTLNLQLPLVTNAEAAAKGSEKSFLLGIPQAAVLPELQLDLPDSVQEIRWNGHKETRKSENYKNGKWFVPVMGPMSELKVSWREPKKTSGARSLNSADWKVDVHLLKQQLLTIAQLTLFDPGRKRSQWRLALNPNAQIEIKGQPENTYKLVDSKSPGIFVIQGPPTEKLEVGITIPQERKGNRFLVGPFLVQDVESQGGVFKIHTTREVLRGQRLTFSENGNLRKQDIDPKDPPDLVAVFKSWNLTQGLKPGQIRTLKGVSRFSHLEINLRPVSAMVNTTAQHSLRIQKGMEPGWEVVTITRIKANPIQNGVDFLDIYLPRDIPSRVNPGLNAAGMVQTFPANLLNLATNLKLQKSRRVKLPKEYICREETGAAEAELIQFPGQNKARIQFDRLLSKPFQVLLVGTYQAAPGVNPITLQLPKPSTLVDHGGKIEIELDESLDLTRVNKEFISFPGGKGTFRRDYRQSPGSIILGWKPRKPKLPITIAADLTIRDRHIFVRQKFHFDFSDWPGNKKDHSIPRQVELSIPKSIQSLEIIRGGFQLDPGQPDESIRIELAPKIPLELKYYFPLSKKTQQKAEKSGAAFSFQVPLVLSKQATSNNVKVRIWSHTGTIPHIPENDPGRKAWKDRGIEVVSGNDSLPSLVLESDQLNPKLRLALPPSKAGPTPKVWIDRALVQVLVDEEGNSHYQARFLLKRIETQSLTIQFPPVLSQDPEIWLDNRKILPEKLAGKSDYTEIRLPIEPKLYNQPVILKITFRLSQDAIEDVNLWQVLLQPPKIVEDHFLARLRWQVSFPRTQVPVVLGKHVHSPQQWRWQGWLLAPESQVSSEDLENWLSSAKTKEEPFPPGLVFSGEGTAPIRLFLIPRQAWLLICSSVFLLIGIGVISVPLGRFGLWFVVTLLGLGFVALGLVWSSILPTFVYGIQPGVAIFLMILILQWLWQRRYQRKVVFLPTFTRRRTGSSLVRSTTTRPREQPSTVDAPEDANNGSSVAGRGSSHTS